MQTECKWVTRDSPSRYFENLEVNCTLTDTTISINDNLKNIENKVSSITLVC